MKQKLLVTLIFYLAWIVLGTLGFLPAFFHDTPMGRSHSIFNPLTIILDVAIYIAVTHLLVTIIFALLSRTSRKQE